MPTKIPVKSDDEYKVTLETSGKTITKSGKTILDAFEAMGLDWHDIKAKGVITVTKGSKSYHRNVPFSTVQLRKLFGSKEVRQLWSGRFKYLLNLQ